ncbi:cytochrome b5-like heme/steroid binding domain-containing protein [Hyaloraphidium curvatum]|nr:cytochrome b5-like heme/steroid binding domain-containing protein [Hyaloraphidium curvatum]
MSKDPKVAAPPPPRPSLGPLAYAAAVALFAVAIYALRSSSFSPFRSSEPGRPDTRAAWEAAGRPLKEFSVAELALYDGTDVSKPIYLAILGEVFDVTAGATYYAKPDGGYSFFSGVDASRSYATGCFQTHLTHDLRGLTEKQVKSIRDWADFYRKSSKYFKVGTVALPPIDPDSPIPPDCNAPKS